MTNSKNGQNTRSNFWLKRYTKMPVSMERFKSWTRRQQQSYLDFKEQLLKNIKTRLDSRHIVGNQRYENARAYTKTRREINSKWAVYREMDKVSPNERIWLEIGHRHRHQTTLTQWVPGIHADGPPKNI